MQQNPPTESSGADATRKCPRPVLLYREREGLPVQRVLAPCRARRCEHCGPTFWRPKVLAQMHSGVIDGRDDYLAILLTAPGKAEGLTSYLAIHDWNGGASRRWHHFMTLLRREYPRRDVQFWRVAELQERGAVHFHVVIRGIRRMSKRRLRRMATQAGFGRFVGIARPADYAGGVRSAGYYFAKYLLKSFPTGGGVTRMVTMSQGWKLTWVDRRRQGDSPSGWVYRGSGQRAWGTVVSAATPPRPTSADSSLRPSWWRLSWQEARRRAAPSWPLGGVDTPL